MHADAHLAARYRCEGPVGILVFGVTLCVIRTGLAPPGPVEAHRHFHCPVAYRDWARITGASDRFQMNSETCGECVGFVLYLMYHFSFLFLVRCRHWSTTERRWSVRPAALSSRANPTSACSPVSCHQPPAEADAKSLIISLVLEWHFTKRRKRQRDSSDHRRTEIQKGQQGDENAPCSFFYYIHAELNWTELGFMALMLLRVYQYSFLTSQAVTFIPPRWLIFWRVTQWFIEVWERAVLSCAQLNTTRNGYGVSHVTRFCYLSRLSYVKICVCVCLEPHFLHAIEYGNYVYFFLSEIAVEYTTLGKVRPAHHTFLPN